MSTCAMIRTPEGYLTVATGDGRLVS
jgi:hypothetical protein